MFGHRCCFNSFYSLAVAAFLSILLNGCIGFTSTPQSKTNLLAPTYTKVPVDTPLPTVTITRTIQPTRTSLPTTAPYNKIPEQVDDGWQTASLVAVGIDPLWISKMLGSIYLGDRSGDSLTTPKGRDDYQNIHSILIVKDGYLVFEEYFYYFSREISHAQASVTKSITSLLAGLAIEQGYLDSVEEKVLPYFPEYLPLGQEDERKENITIEDLLTMRHGMACDDWDPTFRDTYVMSFLEPDAIESILNINMEFPPGSHYSYCTVSTIVLGGVLTKATGMKVPEFANQALFDPMGIKSTSWTAWVYIPGGWTDTGGGLNLLPRDMAKIGLMMLQNGKWNGKQIISEDWVHQSTQEHVILDSDHSWGSGYGYLWRLGNKRIMGSIARSFYALGGGGQVIAIFPELNMVIVITAGNYENDEGQSFEIMERFILPAVLGY